MKRALIPASLLLLTACQQPGPAVLRPYAAAEEGLTLVYINPALPQDQQAAQRLQVRVDNVVDREDGAKVVFKSFTVGVQPPFQSKFVLNNSGLGLLSPDGKSELPLLPEGFPDRVASWTRAGAQFRVLGRGAWILGTKVLPADRGSEGIWVEARTENGAVSRSLYLPAFGEVQTDERQPDGRWLTVNLLTQYGFTDLPMAPPAEQQADPPAKKRAAKTKTKH
ncbi:MAG TPA: hypothetical protein VFF76_09845 [Holophagaceae bacterium]|nr:hypothetical protein [Holophagaceae bacterium]